MTRVYPYTWLAITAQKKKVIQQQTPSFDFNCPMHDSYLPVHMAAQHYKKGKKQRFIFRANNKQQVPD